MAVTDLAVLSLATLAVVAGTASLAHPASAAPDSSTITLLNKAHADNLRAELLVGNYSDTIDDFDPTALHKLVSSSGNIGDVVSSLVQNVNTQGWDGAQGEWTATLKNGTVLWWSDAKSWPLRVSPAQKYGLHGMALWALDLSDPIFVTSAQADDFSISDSPSSGSVSAGGSATSTVSTAAASGSAESVALTASGAHTANWDTPAIGTVTLVRAAGTNSVLFSNTGTTGDVPDIDKITVPADYS